MYCEHGKRVEQLAHGHARLLGDGLASTVKVEVDKWQRKRANNGRSASGTPSIRALIRWTFYYVNTVLPHLRNTFLTNVIQLCASKANTRHLICSGKWSTRICTYKRMNPLYPIYLYLLVNVRCSLLRHITVLYPCSCCDTIVHVSVRINGSTFPDY